MFIKHRDFMVVQAHHHLVRAVTHPALPAAL
jgi:hypothetical protein